MKPTHLLEAGFGRFGIVLNDARTLDEIREELVSLSQSQQAIQNKADKEGRDLSAAEIQQLDELFDRYEVVNAELDRREKIIANAERLQAPNDRQTPPTDPQDSAPLDNSDPARALPTAAGGRRAEPPSPRIEIVESSSERRRHGYPHLGSFAADVVAASRPGNQQVSNRLQVYNAPTTFGSEGVGEDGGFLVPPEFRDAIMTKVLGEESLISRTDQLTSSRNSITVPTDETTPWDTAGIDSNWEGEAGQMTQTKPKLRETSVRLNKLTTLVGVTSELLEDAPAMDGYLRRKAPQKMLFKVNRAVVAGTGAGQPLGILNSGALISVSKEGGQAADTILFENIVNMWSRMYSGSWANAVWLANQDVLPQLLSLGFPTSATAVPVFIPPGGLADSPFGRLMGRPIIFTEAMETLGDLGDIILCDLTQYMTATKVGGLRAETSMHLWFDFDVMAFRFILRVAGHPWWSAPIDARSGAASSTKSCFVSLAERG